MNKFKLMDSAEESAKFRGHDLMFKWHKLDKYRSVNQCSICRKQVVINTAPLPNEIDISGEAIAIGCND